MARRSFKSTSLPARMMRRAWRWDARLPRPLLLLLLLDLALLLPIPFMLPTILAESAPSLVAYQPQALPPLLPLLGSDGGSLAPIPATAPLPRSAIEVATTPPLLLDAVRLQDASFADTNTVAALLAHLAPKLATHSIDVGGGLQQPLASVLTGQALRWNLNPLVLLALLETQNQLFSTVEPATTTLELALRGPSSERGLGAQITWAALELRAGLSEPISTTLMLADGTIFPTPANLDQANYALLRFLARSHTANELDELLGVGSDSWLAAAGRVMGDPRTAARVRVDDTPFLQRPFTGAIRPIARFDHNYPLIQRDGVMLGNDPSTILGYDGHNGWDYQLDAGAAVLAAATGRVVWAGWMDNDCATPAGVVVLAHANGYRTTYWHLARVDVAVGDALLNGTPLGLVGNSGCAVEDHLHFGVQRLGRDVDPAGWCQATPDPWAAHPVGATSRWLWLDQADPCALANDVIVADDSDAATTLIVGENWRVSNTGNYGGARWTKSSITNDAALTWRPATPIAGRYHVHVFIPNTAGAAGLAPYHISHADGETTVAINQRDHLGSWVSLGTYRFGAGQTARITLRAADGTLGDALWFDAIALQLASDRNSDQE